MGVAITFIHGVQDEKEETGSNCLAKSVESLAIRVLEPLLPSIKEKITHFIVATSCPDSIAPSLGQCLNERLNDHLEYATTYDIVQGCAGGVSALILGSQLAAMHHSSVVIVAADAAQKATSPTSDIFPIFSNGAFSCLVEYVDDERKLIHAASRQFKNLFNVVTIKLGHDADTIIQNNLEDMATDPRKHLGLSMNNQLALQLMRKAEQFFLDFIIGQPYPDVLILHHVNPLILGHLEEVFSKFPVRFINMANEIGNCGSATTGVILSRIWTEVQGKKVMMCSFGTGGVITAGMWQL